MSELKKLIENRLYLLSTLLVGVLSYGFSITHYSMGIDDTSMGMYLDKGLLPETGRWVLFLLNKLVHISDFAPYFSEVIGFALLYVSALVFCELLMRISGDKLPVFSYIVFTAFFISNPLFSENDIYYLHNAADIGWLCIAVSLLISYEIYKDHKKGFKNNLSKICSAVALLWVAAGCYESFIFVYMTCVLLIIFIDAAIRNEKIGFAKLIGTVFCAGIGCLAALICRIIICKIIPVLFGLDDVTSSYVGYRGALSGLKDVFFSGDAELFKELVRDQIVTYHLNGFVYLPIALNVITMMVLLAACITLAVRKKSPAFVFVWLFVEMIPFFQSFILGYISPLRSAQVIPVTVGIMMAYIVYLADGLKKKRKPVCIAVGIVFGILILNSSSRLNYNFYLDRMRYENDKNLMLSITEDAYRTAGVRYGDELNVYFAGHMSVPLAFRDEFYISVNDSRFKIMSSLVSIIDPSVHSLNKHVMDGKYFFDGEMVYPMFLWGKEAFNGTNDELVRFINIHGAGLTTIHDMDEIRRAKEEAESMPSWPADGSILVKDGYVLINV